MIYPHEKNIKHKIESNYNNKGKELDDLYNNIYSKFKKNFEELDFKNKNIVVFRKAAELIDSYCSHLKEFSDKNNITSQSKFESSFLEEISVYLFKNIKTIQDGTFNFFNKGIYAGLKLGTNNQIIVITKDVDFCIGKESIISFDNTHKQKLILPIISVEVKTYLDATMLGEVKSSSKAIRSAAPNSRAYVLMGYKNLKDEHIKNARQDSFLNEIFVLRENQNSKIDPNALLQYYTEINKVIENYTDEEIIPSVGKQLNPSPDLNL